MLSCAEYCASSKAQVPIKEIGEGSTLSAAVCMTCHSQKKKVAFVSPHRSSNNAPMLGLCEPCSGEGHGIVASCLTREFHFNRPVQFDDATAKISKDSLPLIKLLCAAMRSNPLPIQVQIDLFYDFKSAFE